MKLSIIVPVYNEQELIAEVLRQILDVTLEGLEREIVVVDDGSTDGSLAIIHELARHNPEIRPVAAPINMGKGAAVRIGFSRADGDLLMIQDADLELDPKEYSRLLAPILAGEADVVYGSRFRNPPNGLPWPYLWGNCFLTWTTNLLYGSHLTDMETAYKLFKVEVVRSLRLRCVGFDIEPHTAQAQTAHYFNLEKLVRCLHVREMRSVEQVGRPGQETVAPQIRPRKPIGRIPEAGAVDHIRLSSQDGSQEARVLLWIEFQVGVLNHEQISISAAEPDAHGGPLAHIDGCGDGADLWVVSGQFVDDGEASVCGAIVHHDNLPFQPLQGDVQDLPEHLSDKLLFVVHRDDNGEFHAVPSYC